MNYKKKYLKYKLKYLTLKKLLSRQHQMKGGEVDTKKLAHDAEQCGYIDWNFLNSELAKEAMDKRFSKPFEKMNKEDCEKNTTCKALNDDWMAAQKVMAMAKKKTGQHSIFPCEGSFNNKRTENLMKGGFSLPEGCSIDGVCGIVSRCKKGIDNVVDTASEVTKNIVDKAVDTGCEWVDKITFDKVEMEDIVKEQKKIITENFEDQSKRLLVELKNSTNIKDQEKQKQWNEMCDKMQKNANYFSSLEKLQEEQKNIEEDCKSEKDDICPAKTKQQEKINEARTNMRNHMKKVGNYSYFPCGISFEEHQEKQKIIRELLPKLEKEKAKIFENAEANKQYVATVEKLNDYGQRIAAGLKLLGIDGTDTAATVSSVLTIALIGDITDDKIKKKEEKLINELNTNFINEIDTFVKNNHKPTEKEKELNNFLQKLDSTEQEIVNKSRNMINPKEDVSKEINQGLVNVGKNAIHDVIMNKVLGENLSKKVSDVIGNLKELNETTK